MVEHELFSLWDPLGNQTWLENPPFRLVFRWVSQLFLRGDGSGTGLMVSLKTSLDWTVYTQSLAFLIGGWPTPLKHIKNVWNHHPAFEILQQLDLCEGGRWWKHLPVPKILRIKPHPLPHTPCYLMGNSQDDTCSQNVTKFGIPQNAQNAAVDGAYPAPVDRWFIHSMSKFWMEPILLISMIRSYQVHVPPFHWINHHQLINWSVICGSVSK